MANEESCLVPQTVTGITQAPPEQIAVMSEQVLEVNKLMSSSKDELENLSACLNDLAYTKQEYDKAAKRVKKQMRELIPII